MDHGLLVGARVVVTRASDQASTLSRALAGHGAEVVEVPTIAIIDPADGGDALRAALAGVAAFDWLVVTSPNGAVRVVAALPDPGVPARAGVRVAVVGPGTGAALAGLGVHADLVPERFVAEGLLDAFPAPPPHGGWVLLAQAAGARPVLAEGLEAVGWAVEVVEAYRTVNPPVDAGLAAAALEADVVTFTSASTVTGFVAAVGGRRPRGAVVCIGPVTADAARAAGLSVAAVADPHTVAGLVAAVIAHRAGAGG